MENGRRWVWVESILIAFPQYSGPKSKGSKIKGLNQYAPPAFNIVKYGKRLQADRRVIHYLKTLIFTFFSNLSYVMRLICMEGLLIWIKIRENV